ncbi:MAG: type II CAAX endopeptidase family protein [Spirochaetota bacterium]
MNFRTCETVILLGTLGLAFALWYVIFVLSFGNFWVKISLSSALLSAGSLLVMKKNRGTSFRFRYRYIIEGVLSAVLLYGIFLLGKLIITTAAASSGEAIAAVYAPRKDFPVWLIGVLLFFVTSPAEEIFWRGFVQRKLMQHAGTVAGFLLASGLYAGVHVWTLNAPLILAAFTAGCMWGLLYLVERALVPVIVSHAVWSLAAFVLFPFS